MEIGAGPQFMLALTKEVVVIGDTASAALATEAVLARSQHCGWIRNTTESRRAAAEWFVACDKGNDRRSAVELLASDYFDRSISARKKLGAIESNLRIVGGDTDPLTVWKGLRPHIAAVAKPVQKPATPPTLADATTLFPGNLPVRLLFDMAQPASPVVWEARAGLPIFCAPDRLDLATHSGRRPLVEV